MQTVASFVQGAGGGGWEWAIWRRVFVAAGWRCATPDLMPAAQGIAHTRWDDYLAQTLATARALQGDGAPGVLVGASLGGLLAWAASSQLAVAALVLVNPLLPDGLLQTVVPDASTSVAPPAIAAPAEMGADPVRAGVLPWARRRALASTLRAMPDADAAARLFAFRRWRDESAAVLAEVRCLPIPPRPACPVLVIASECDSDVPPAASAALAQHLGATLHRVPDASHVGPLLGASAATVAARAVEWLGGVA